MQVKSFLVAHGLNRHTVLNDKWSNGTDVKYEIVQRDDNDNDLYEIRLVL